MNDLEQEIIRVGNQIDETKSIQEIERLFFETKKKLKSAEKDGLTEKIRKLSVGNIVFVVYKLREFYEEWEKNRKLFGDEEKIIVAERVIEEVFKIIDKIDKADFPPYFSEKHLSEAKKGLIDFRMKIDEEKEQMKGCFNGK